MNKQQRKKMYKLGLLKIKKKNFCTIEGTTKKGRRQVIKWEKKYFQIMYLKVVVYSLYKQLLRLNNKKDQSNLKISKGFELTFL